jgi:DNA-binding MarR family transcriptional regulator
MWATEHSVETSAALEEIWQLWADVADWPDWNGDIERIELIGPFAAGSRILMTPIGEEPIELRIAEAVEPERFVDEAEWARSWCGRSIALSVSSAEAGGSPTGWRSPARPQTPLGRRLARRSAATSRRRSPRWSRVPRLDGAAPERQPWIPALARLAALAAWRRRGPAPLDLTHVQFVLLACTWWLNEQGERPNQIALAVQAGTDIKMTSQVLRSLERKGLIEREVDTADTRARRVRVTKGGARLAPRAIAVVEQVDSEFFADVPGPQALRFLRRLVQRPDAGAATADKRTVGSAGPSQRRRS